MIWLLLASIIWAYSFGVIGNILAGVPAPLVAGVRLALATLVFLPFLRNLSSRDTAIAMAIGAVQFGFMYIFYNASFAYMPSHHVALLTVFTPLYVALACCAMRCRQVTFTVWLAVALAVLGAGLMVWSPDDDIKSAWHGFWLVQASNLCFAIGQLAYRGWTMKTGQPPADHTIMGWLYIGGLLAVCPWAAVSLFAGPVVISTKQWLALVYLGLIASGFSFFLWNYGARRTTPGMLAVCNNLKIPFAASVSLLVFKEYESTSLVHFVVGAVLLIGAMVLAHFGMGGEQAVTPDAPEKPAAARRKT
jgi:drug/metabolite transporter (DMT)-like permease